MITTHSPVERAIRKDLSEKNALRRELEDRLKAAARWKARLAAEKKRGRGKRLEQSLSRYAARIEALRKDVLARDRDLQKRIVAEMKFSEQEVRDFESRYKKELDEAVKARASIAAAQKEEKDAEARGEPTVSDLLRKVGRARRQALKEDKDVKAVEKELTSEAKDRALFEAELQRIAAEIIHFGRA